MKTIYKEIILVLVVLGLLGTWVIVHKSIVNKRYRVNDISKDIVMETYIGEDLQRGDDESVGFNLKMQLSNGPEKFNMMTAKGTVKIDGHEFLIISDNVESRSEFPLYEKDGLYFGTMLLTPKLAKAPLEDAWYFSPEIAEVVIFIGGESEEFYMKDFKKVLVLVDKAGLVPYESGKELIQAL